MSRFAHLHLLVLILVLSTIVLWPDKTIATDLFNPAPLEDDLILPGPGNSSFVFRPIMVRPESGEGPMAGARFVMGDPSGDFRAPPTAVVIGGAFIGITDKDSRIYYMGKYEVTEAQYYAVTGLPKGMKKDKLTSSMPITNISYFEALHFVDLLNTWLYSHALEDMPSAGPFPGFVRLPTETEWEFAARGGSAVEAVVRDAPFPYGEDLGPYEWFSGPGSSHNKVQATGRLKANPLGLHDMLGNVREITQSHYHIEYYQGRSGGFVARGGHYLTNEDDMNAALRTEEPYYLGSIDKGMRPNRKPTMGLRLVLSAPLLTDRDAIAEIEDSWENYRSGPGATLPAALSVTDVSSREAVSSQGALERLQRIKTTLQQAGLASSLQQDIAATEASLRTMAQVRRQADEDSARVWVKMAGERGLYLANNLRGLAVAKEAPTEKLRQRAEQYDFNVRSGLDNYGEIMAELGKLPKEIVIKGFVWHSDSLEAKIAREQRRLGAESEARMRDIRGQLAWLKTTRAHYEKYEKEKLFDAAAWRKDYAASPLQ